MGIKLIFLMHRQGIENLKNPSAQGNLDAIHF